MNIAALRELGTRATCAACGGTRYVRDGDRPDLVYRECPKCAERALVADQNLAALLDVAQAASDALREWQSAAAGDYAARGMIALEAALAKLEG